MDCLPPDCFRNALSYLTLRECLQFASCSQSALLNAVVDIKRRRYEQFICQRSYRVLNQARTRVELRIFPSSTATTAMAVNKEAKDPSDMLEDKEDTSMGYSLAEKSDKTISSQKVMDVWRNVPSVKERIECLYRALPSGHPLENDLKELLSDLRVDANNFPLPSAFLSYSIETGETTISLLRKVTRAHRLHSSVLKSCVLHPHGNTQLLKKVDGNSSQRYNPTQLNSASLRNSICLSRYIGDCLTASYLSGNNLIVEGGFNWTEWTCHVFRDIISNGKGGARLEECYRAWVLLFCMALQHGRFTAQERKELGLCPLSAFVDAPSFVNELSNDRGVLLQPHYPFMVITTPGFISNTIPLVLDATRRFAIASSGSRLRTVFMEFGPLGPAFRGRDNVRSTTASFYQLLVNVGLLCYQSFFVMSPDHLINPNFFRVHAEWMLSLSRECRKSRPITVMEPYIELSQGIRVYEIEEPLVDGTNYTFLSPRV